jgi:hypothetical protein
MQRWTSINDIFLDSTQYPVKKPKPLKNGQIKVTFSIPIFQGKVTITCLPDELPKLAYGHRGLLGATIAWQCHVAEMTLHPNPLAPKRGSSRNIVKWMASNDAKRLHPTIVYFHKHPEVHYHRYAQLVKAVGQTSVSKNGPTPREITAWLIEQLYLGDWDFVGLKRPTDDIARFAKEYLYTPPHMISCTPENLPEQSEQLWQILNTEKISKKISNIEVSIPLTRAKSIQMPI